MSTGGSERPRIVASTSALGPEVGDPGATGALWHLTGDERGLDANVVQLPPGGRIDRHAGPALDVLWHVVAGAGRLLTDGDGDGDGLRIGPGDVVHLPRGTERGVVAGEGGLRYLTVHDRKPPLGLGPTRS
ncbi:cupin domain-containing protein [Georgenia sp. Z1491]|uniref:cupin domain-containing protein n=1 Tax=Georgenia sp. Z1491 TaxID=3416707 RepID=UPI003CE99B7A